jgi:hypothetical protein
MFNNIGRKLKILAYISFILGIGGSIISSIAYFILGSVLTGILIIILGSLCSWVCSWGTYAIGLLVENNEQQQEDLILIQSKLRALELKLQSANQDEKTPATPKVVVTPTPKTKAATPLADDQAKEQTYLFAMQMYQQRSYDIAYNAFLKIPGYKDADKYIQELTK